MLTFPSSTRKPTKMNKITKARDLICLMLAFHPCHMAAILDMMYVLYFRHEIEAMPV